MCEVEEGCGCRIAVTRVYRELKQRNIPDVAAFDTATAIFRLHHPEVPLFEARYAIAEWLGENE